MTYYDGWKVSSLLVSKCFEIGNEDAIITQWS